MLTPKQERFCQCIVSGMSAKDSYYTAYDTKCGEKTAYTEATRLLSRDDIQAKLVELRKPLENQAQAQAIADRDTKRSWLWDIINDPNKDDSHRLRAMDILCRVDAEYNNSVMVNQSGTVNLSAVDLDALKALAE